MNIATIILIRSLIRAAKGALTALTIWTNLQPAGLNATLAEAEAIARWLRPISLAARWLHFRLVGRPI